MESIKENTDYSSESVIFVVQEESGVEHCLGLYSTEKEARESVSHLTDDLIIEDYHIN